MLYCTEERNLEGNIINKILPRNKRIYYDKEKDLFFNQDHKAISIKDRVVVPVSNARNLSGFYSLLQSKGALFTNSQEDIIKIENWFEYIEPYRQIVLFEPNDLSDAAFLTYLIELFDPTSEIYLTKLHESFPVDISVLINGLTSIISNNKTLLLSEKIDINEDEHGKIEYQVLVERGKLVNLSRLCDSEEYIETPREVFQFIFEFLESLPKSFPKTFILRIASTKNMYDIMDIIPLELAASLNKTKQNLQEPTGLKMSKTSKV